jgi:predicted GNAT family acetyltransferase
MTTEVLDNPQESRYEIRVDGELAGFAEYEREDGRLALTHTEIDDAHQGQGLAGKLIGATLDAARKAELQVRPYCPYVRSYIGKHEDQVDLVAPEDRPRFGL